MLECPIVTAALSVPELFIVKPLFVISAIVAT